MAALVILRLAKAGFHANGVVATVRARVGQMEVLLMRRLLIVAPEGGIEDSDSAKAVRNNSATAARRSRGDDSATGPDLIASRSVTIPINSDCLMVDWESFKTITTKF